MRLFILVTQASYFLLGYAASLILGHILFGRCSLKLELLKHTNEDSWVVFLFIPFLFPFCPFPNAFYFQQQSHSMP